MKLVTFSSAQAYQKPGVLVENGIYPLPYPDMLELIRAGISGLKYLEQALEGISAHNLLSLEEVQLLAPLLRPTTIRDFYAFEQHVSSARANRGKPVPEVWYEIPVFYFSNPNAIFGPEDTIPYPKYSHALDYELEIACIIGEEAQDLNPEQAENIIFGFTIMNDWSARDEQRREMQLGLGPAKGKDFATSLGPWIVTPNELKKSKTSRPGVYNLEMIARVNGKEYSRGNFNQIYHDMGSLIARASQSTRLYPGDLIGSGTVGSGCLLEITGGKGPWLMPGDLVELEIESLGILRNTIGNTESVP